MRKQKCSFDFVKSCIDSENWLENTLEMLQHFPPVPFYGHLLKYKAIKLLREGNPESGVAHLSNSHSVGLQHKSINIHHNLVSKRKEPVSESPEENQEENSEEHGSDNCMQCNIISHPSWLQTLPVEWTVVQISELRIGKEIFKELGGPPHPNIDLPDLVIARFRCGPSRSGFLTNELGRPTKGIECGGLLSELNSILEGNKVINKDFCGPRETYFKVRQEHHNQLKVLVNSLENWWLGFNKCLLVGELKDEPDINLLNQLTTHVARLVKSSKGSISKEQEQWICQLLSSFSHLTRVHLIRGLSQSLNEPPCSQLLTEILKYLTTVETDLNQLKNARRNPVILVLDKVIQQLPWESMIVLESTPLTRIPSLHMLRTLALKHGYEKRSVTAPTIDLKLNSTSRAIQVNPKLAYYILNPGQDLPGVQERMQPILERIWGKKSGVIGTIPVVEDIKQSLMARDVFLYCGHGSGTKYMPLDHIVKLNCRAAPLLMGCSSGQLKANGRQVDPTGAAANYLMAGSPSLVGMLWEVTDLDCDRFTIRFLGLWLGTGQKHNPPTSNDPHLTLIEPELSRAVTASRQATRYFNTGAAAVVYGLPVMASL